MSQEKAEKVIITPGIADEILSDALEATVAEIIRPPHEGLAENAAAECRFELAQMGVSITNAFRAMNLPPAGDPANPDWRQNFADSTAAILYETCGEVIKETVNTVRTGSSMASFAGPRPIVERAVRRLSSVVAQVARCQEHRIDPKALLGVTQPSSRS